jgi:ABC-type antimicrobial peptide transport system permease subunit
MFHEQETYAPRSAIFVGNTTWNRMVHKVTASENESQLIMMDHYNQIFLNAKNDSSTALQDIQSDLFLDHGSLAYAIRASEWVELLERQLTQTNSFLTVILSFTTIIAFFAVFASTQTSVLESQTELGVIKAIGLPDHALVRIFALVNLDITIVSTILGAFVRYALAYFQNFQTYIFLEMSLPVIMLSEIIFIVLGGCYD